MLTYRILISSFDNELQSADITWNGRQLRWGVSDGVIDLTNKMHDYLRALADNTRKPPTTCMELAAKYAFPEASIEVMTPKQVNEADATPAVE